MIRTAHLIALTFLWLCSLPAFAQKHRLKFEHLGTQAGLSQGSIICIYQDTRGFMWFGTRDGLNKYDGYTFTVYRNDPRNPHSLSNNTVRDIVEDADGNLWIATLGGGLNKFERETEKFTAYKYRQNDNNSLSTDLLNCLLFDHTGQLWIGTRTKGLDMFDPKTQSFRHYPYDPAYNNSVSSKDVRDLVEDQQHNIWIGTNGGGLNRLDRTRQSFTQYQHDEQKTSSISSNKVWCIYQDARANLWIGTYGGGLNLLNPASGAFERFMKDEANSNSIAHNVLVSMNSDPEGNLYIGTENGGLSIYNPQTRIFRNYHNDDSDPTSLSSNSINSVFRDAKGNMWIGTFNGALNFLSRDAAKFIHYRYNRSANSLSSNKVLSILEDSDQNIWIGTDGGGLNLFDRETESFTHFLHEDGNANTIAGNYILKIFEDSEKNLWIGTWGDGITVYNRYNNTYKHFRHDPNDPNSLTNNNCWGIFEDREKKIWIGTFGGGLNLFDPVAQNFTHYKHDENDPASIGSNKVYSIVEDRQGRLLIGTDDGGFNIFNKETQRFTVYKYNPNANSISNNNVDCILEDSKGNIWLSTDAGLNHFDPATEIFISYSMKDGLPNDMIMGILEDSKGNLWISTNRGISLFDRRKNTFKNFTTSDGLQSDEFKEEAYCKTRSGALLFGGNNGFNVFFPDSINDSPFDPPIVLTNFQIFNKNVSLAHEQPGSPLKKSVSETTDITLSHESSVISFEFASLNYGDRNKRKYAYMLEGFDKEWHEVGTQHAATYTNLDPGKYTFAVKGLDNQGGWSKQRLAVKLTITPPFWLTPWFKALAAITVSMILIAIFRIRLGVIKKQKQHLQQQVEERTKQLAKSTEEAERARQDAEQANRAKSIFLATMSHEIRTPMNGVLGMASLLAETALTSEQRDYTHTIQQSGETLLGVINDILDFSKIESGKMELEVKDFNLRDCIEEVFDVFSAKASTSGLDLLYEIDYNVPSQIMGDSLRLRQVLINLVSNAIKFTHQGEIFLGVSLRSLHQNQVTLHFEVRDTGIGIPADKLKRLFKAFSQVDSSTTRKYGGTGLGLAISEKLIILMGGSIDVESEPGIGTRFMFTINTAISMQSTKNYVHLNVSGIEGKKVLLVDDNETNLAILKNQLVQWKLVPVVAYSGQEALDILASGQHTFDLVLTDMQMPGMDGLQFTQRLHRQHAGIPVMLLSSIGDERTRQHQNLFCSVLTKPVKQQVLHKHIVGQLRQTGKVTATDERTEKNKLNDAFSAKHPLTILIAEDNPVNQKLAERVLMKLGYKPDMAANGREALEAVKSTAYDLIFMDVQMPEMDGLEATRAIRNMHQMQPVIIAMTANALQGDREMCLNAGMDDYISKPIKLDDLVCLLQQWARKRQQSA